LAFQNDMARKATQRCKCGFHGDGSDRCTCDPTAIANYRGRISGPLLDRIDLHVSVPPVPFRELAGEPAGEGSAQVRECVVRAREVQSERFRGIAGVHNNGQMGAPEICCCASPEVARLLQRAVDRLGLSARAYHAFSRSRAPSRISRAWTRSDRLMRRRQFSTGAWTGGDVMVALIREVIVCSRADYSNDILTGYCWLNGIYTFAFPGLSGIVASNWRGNTPNP
jgi:hypothetical protein